MVISFHGDLPVYNDVEFDVTKTEVTEDTVKKDSVIQDLQVRLQVTVEYYY